METEFLDVLPESIREQLITEIADLVEKANSRSSPEIHPYLKKYMEQKKAAAVITTDEIDAILSKIKL